MKCNFVKFHDNWRGTPSPTNHAPLPSAPLPHSDLRVTLSVHFSYVCLGPYYGDCISLNHRLACAFKHLRLCMCVCGCEQMIFIPFAYFVVKKVRLQHSFFYYVHSFFNSHSSPFVSYKRNVVQSHGFNWKLCKLCVGQHGNIPTLAVQGSTIP